MPTNTDGVQEQPASIEQDSVQRLAEADAHALRALAEAWAEEHDLHDSVGAFEAGWEARQPIIDSLTAERDTWKECAEGAAAELHVSATHVAEERFLAEAAEEEVKRLRAALMAHHEAGVLARTVGVETHQAWGMRCPFCAAASATPPSEGGQS